MKKILIPLFVIMMVSPTYAHMPPKDQALIILKEVDNYNFEFLIFPKKPETGTVTEVILNATYLEDERPYIGGVKMRVEALNVEGGVPFEVLEFPSGEKGVNEGSAVQYDIGHYEITVVFATNGTYAVTAWPESEEDKFVIIEFFVSPRSLPNLIFLGFLGILVLGILMVVYLFPRRRG